MRPLRRRRCWSLVEKPCRPDSRQVNLLDPLVRSNVINEQPIGGFPANAALVRQIARPRAREQRGRLGSRRLRSSLDDEPPVGPKEARADVPQGPALPDQLVAVAVALQHQQPGQESERP